MSLVTLVATKDFISVLTDGRASDGNTIHTENYPKYEMLDEKVFIAFTGGESLAKVGVQQAKYLHRQGNNIGEIAKILQQSLIEEVPVSRKVSELVNFLIGGISERGDLEYFYVSSKNSSLEQMERYSPKEYDLLFYILGGDKLPECIKQFSTLLEKRINTFGFNETGIVSIQKEFQSLVSKTDESVNQTYFHKIIKK